MAKQSWKSKEVEEVEAIAPTLDEAVTKVIQDIEAGKAVEQDLDDLLNDKSFRGPPVVDTPKDKPFVMPTVADVSKEN